MTSYNLSHHPGSQCHVEIHNNGTIEFISYTTLVIRATPINLFSFMGREIFQPVPCEYPNRYIIECTGTYSATTRKQIGWFLKEYFGDISYQNVKDIVDTNTVIMANRKTAKYW